MRKEHAGKKDKKMQAIIRAMDTEYTSKEDNQ